MRRFIFAERGGIYIIDLTQTLSASTRRGCFLRNVAERGGTVLFVGTKKQAQDAVENEAKRCRDAVRQPPLARRAAHELANDVRPDRAPARDAPPPRRGQMDLLPAKERISMAASSRSSSRTSAASRTCVASPTRCSSST
jgi:hypothetical protein